MYSYAVSRSSRSPSRSPSRSSPRVALKARRGPKVAAKAPLRDEAAALRRLLRRIRVNIYALSAMGCIVDGRVDGALYTVLRDAWEWEVVNNPVFGAISMSMAQVTLLALAFYAPRHAPHILLSLDSLRNLRTAAGLATIGPAGAAGPAVNRQAQEMLRALREARAWASQWMSAETPGEPVPVGYRAGYGECHAMVAYLADGEWRCYETAHAPSAVMALPDPAAPAAHYGSFWQARDQRDLRDLRDLPLVEKATGSARR